MAILFKADSECPDDWLEALARHLPGHDLRIYPDAGNKADIDYALVYAPPPGLLGSLVNLKAIFSLWAGVDHLKSDPHLPDLPVVRMVEAGMTSAMVEFIVGRVIAWNRRFHDYNSLQRERKWQALPYRAAHKTRIGILGLGELGLSAARALQGLGYDVKGWSRSPKSIEGLKCTFGREGLATLTRELDILICLLPLTDQTRAILSKELFLLLPKGCYLINCARGGHLVEGDLIAALESGQLGGAALDVFSEEPLGREHPFWGNEKIALTPHVSAPTVPDTAIQSVAETIRRFEDGKGLRYLVDFSRGY